MRSTLNKLLVTASVTGMLLAGGAGIASAATGPTLPTLPDVPSLPGLTDQCLRASLSHSVSNPLDSLLSGLQDPAAGVASTLHCLESLLGGGGLPGLSTLPALPDLPVAGLPAIGS